ncbi:serine hydrolase domain-containing protein [Brevundimonas nasdae]|uniref:serine hydrolase domain-containing protein n=2 Tax=Brevundimonas nasdae TaxID=172043 RepID=UPI001F17C5CC|nr:serine hydrolase domain-containing protein [Brevundimonas nasdae]
MIMDRRTVLISGLASTLPVGAASAAEASAYEAVLDKLFAEKAPVALAGGVVTRDGLIWSGVRGVRQVGGSDAATPDDRWHLGSNTKAMTAALYARLVEQGRAAWDAPLSTLFPGAAIDPAWSGVTITDFIQHRAGLKDEDALGMVFFMTSRDDPRPWTVQRRAIAEAALAKPPTGARGAFEYANVNYILVGAAIEQITGGSWEDAMKAEVFTPLGLTSAGFGAPAHNVKGGANAWGHEGEGADRVAMDPASPGSDNPLALGPAGTAHMSLADYATWLKVFLTDGGGWLKPESIAALSTPSPGADTPYAGGWIAPPHAPWASGPVLMHEGSNTLWHAVAAVAPVRGVAFIGLSNQGPEAGAANGLMPGLVRALGAAPA